MRLLRVLSPIRDAEVIASGSGIRILEALRRNFGGRNWRKMKGVARVESVEGYIGDAELHWFEAHGVGKVMMKIKRPLGQRSADS